MKGVKEGMLAATVGRHLLHAVGQPVVAVQFGDDRFLEFGGATDRRILGLPLSEGGDRRCFDVLGSVKVRLPSAEVDHLDPLAAQSRNLGSHHQSGRRFDQL